MVSRQVGTRVLGVRILPNADPALREHLDVRPGDRSLGIFTTDCDDVSYAALDEATKKADVSVAYAKSMYAGAANASTALAGEFIGILSGPEINCFHSFPFLITTSKKKIQETSQLLNLLTLTISYKL